MGIVTTSSRLAGSLLLVTALTTTLSAQGGPSCPATTGGAMPLKYSGPATVAAITPCDLMTRLYILADDSMMGRQVGTIYNDMGTAYIAGQVAKLGLKPAGDNGTFFQKLPIFTRSYDEANSSIMAGGTTVPGTDFTASISGTAFDLDNAPVIFGGAALDTTDLMAPGTAAGKIVVLKAAERGAGGGRFRRGGFSMEALRAYQQSMEGAAAVVTIAGDELPQARGGFPGRGSRPSYDDPDSPDPARSGGGTVSITGTTALGQALLGRSMDGMAKGAAGGTASLHIRFNQESAPGRNVVAILPGSDPALRNEYVAIGAHNDHIGFRQGGAEHDSLKAYNMVYRVQGADSRGLPTPDDTAAIWTRINAVKDSLRAIEPAREDSISNGADDDGSGSVSVLEIAEAFARAPERPKRSILFIWHAGEEAGLWGSQYFTDHPTVPRASIVAELNMDMVGRGAATDITGQTKAGDLIHGNNDYVQLVGSRRLSTELGDLAEAVNAKGHGLQFDYSLDANGHPQNIYCRSDHYEYARYGHPDHLLHDRRARRLSPGDRRAAVHPVPAHGPGRPAGPRPGAGRGQSRPSGGGRSAAAGPLRALPAVVLDGVARIGPGTRSLASRDRFTYPLDNLRVHRECRWPCTLPCSNPSRRPPWVRLLASARRSTPRCTWSVRCPSRPTTRACAAPVPTIGRRSTGGCTPAGATSATR